MSLTQIPGVPMGVEGYPALSVEAFAAWDEFRPAERTDLVKYDKRVFTDGRVTMLGNEQAQLERSLRNMTRRWLIDTESPTPIGGLGREASLVKIQNAIAEGRIQLFFDI